jgi:L-glyceraldehyde 3-phosphate reductase
LSRLGLDYVDILYSHRPDPATPLEETMGALHTAVTQGKALYVGISSYGPERTRQAAAILRDLGTPLLIHQQSYSMLNRWVEHGLLDVLDEIGAGAIAFTALAQGLLTPKYLDVGASSVGQLEDNIAAIGQLKFTSDELAAIDAVATDDPDIDLWREQSQLGPDTKAPHSPN